MQPRLREDRQIVGLYFLTDAMWYWMALALSTLSRMDALSRIDFLLIQRDRLVALLLFCITSAMAGVYKPHRISDRFDAVYYSLIGLACTGIAQFLLTTLLPVQIRQITRRELIVAAFLASVFLTIWHYFAAGLVNRFKSLRRFFYVLGSPEHGESIVRELLNHRSSVPAEARYVSLNAFKAEMARRKQELGANYWPTEDAIITLEAKDHGQLDEILLFCKGHCRRTFLYPTVHDVLVLQHRRLHAIAGIPLIEVASRQLTTPYLYVKRGIDLLVSAVGLLLAFPICLGTAFAIKATSRGPILYSQERLGKDGRPFRIYKFRSMIPDVELKDETGHVLAQEDDPRVTPVGRFLRRHRIDEIPQLFNVLKGDMSLIGPRPAWREFYEANQSKIPFLEQRLAVRPGLTCLSHVLGSYSSNPEDRLHYDLLYISTLSFVSDLRILVGTIRIVLSGKGAR